MRRSISWKYIGIYYSIACGVAWAFWAPLALGQDGLRWFAIAPSLSVFASLGTLGPLLGCFVSHRLQYRNWRAVRLFPQSRLRSIRANFDRVLVLSCISSAPCSQSWHWHFGVFPELLGVMLSYSLPCGPLCEEFGWRDFFRRHCRSRYHHGSRPLLWRSCGPHGTGRCFFSTHGARRHQRFFCPY